MPMLSSLATVLLTDFRGKDGKKSTAAKHRPTRPYTESNREYTVSRQSPFGTTNQLQKPADHVEESLPPNGRPRALVVQTSKSIR